MPLIITSEEYNSFDSLFANAGDWVEAETTFMSKFYVGSGNSNKFTYNTTGGNYSLSLQTGNASDWGFLPGDTIVLTYYFYVLGTPVGQSFTTTVLYTTANKIYIASPIPLPVYGGFHVNGRQFPTEDYVSGLGVTGQKPISSCKMSMNLTPNGSQVLGSLIDGELNQFQIEDSSTLAIGVPQPMIQLISKSGGWIKDVDITLLNVQSDYYRNYRIRYKIFQWGVIKDGYPEPNYYNNADCLAPVMKIEGYSQFGNPNGVLTRISDNNEANTGGFNENYNGGLSLYQSTGITWKDYLGDTIQALNYSGLSTFEATVEAPGQSSVNSTYRLGLVWRPIDGTYYQNIATENLGSNLLVIAPETDFIADGTTSPTTFLGEERIGGARWDLSEVNFALTGTTLTIKGKITPNAEATTLFDGIPNGGRLSTLWLSLGEFGTDNTAQSKRVSLQLFNEDNIDAPTKGVQIPDVIDEVLLDHADNVITTPLPQTTTEDDVLYRSNFRLLDNLAYEGIRVEIMAYNDITEEEFSLENAFFSFNSVPFVGGQFQPNFIVPRGFNLPPLSNRNHISITREPSLDIAGKYALKIEYGYLSKWEYWLEQNNANNDFFNINEFAFDGLNRNWQRFSNNGDWKVRIAYYTRLDSVDDFNYLEVGIRPYEDDSTVTTNWDIELLSNNTFPTNFIADELHTLTAILTWSAGVYTNPWAEISIEDYEAGNRWVISSILAQGGIANNPLQPITGQTQLDMTFPSTNMAVLKTNIDTSLLSTNKVCVSARIYSEDRDPPDEWEWLLDNEREALAAYSVARRLGLYYTGPLIRVRRSSDNAEQDIPYIQIGVEWVLDEADLIAFVGTGESSSAWIVTKYNQAIAGQLDARQSAVSSQPPIMINGSILKDPITNRPAQFSDGNNDYFEINGLIGIQPDILSFSVFSDIYQQVSPKYRVGFGKINYTEPSTLYWRVQNNSNKAYSQITSPKIKHFENINDVGGFVMMIWGNGNNPTGVNASINGVFGQSQLKPSLIGTRLDTLEAHARNILHKGWKSEDAIYGEDRIQSPSWIENNVNNFYVIF